MLRYKFSRQYHSDNHCLALTLSIIWLIIPITFPISVSLLGSVPFAIFVCWVGDTAQERIVLRKRISNNDVKPFNVDTCTEEELIKRCKDLRFSEENINLAIEFFIKKTKHSKLADDFFVQEKTITTRKKRMKQKLNK